jgi:hypothetical protein
VVPKRAKIIAGTQVNFELQVTNNGPNPAYSGDVRVMLPEENSVSAVEDRFFRARSRHDIRCEIQSLMASKGVSMQLTLLVMPDYARQSPTPTHLPLTFKDLQSISLAG